RYDIEAKADATYAELSGPMLQDLIEERLKLIVHGETRDLPVYFLTVAKTGSKLKTGPCVKSGPDTRGRPASDYCGNLGIYDNAAMISKSTRIESFANALSSILKRKVLDRTGLTGEYDVNLKWTPDISTPGNNPVPAEPEPSIFTAIEEQLGLKLEAG